MSFFGIGIHNPKTSENVGTLWRSAHILGASFIFVIGNRIKQQSSDTTSAWRSVPMYRYEDFNKFYQNIPYDCQLVGVELDDKSTPIESFAHPKRAVYLLGAEDNGLPPAVRETCHKLIQLPLGNYNVAMAGTVTMYDRHYKEFSSKS